MKRHACRALASGGAVPLRRFCRAFSAEPAVDLNGSPLTVNEVASVAREGRQVSINNDAMTVMSHARECVIKKLEGGEAHYGINTGFGSLARQKVSNEELEQLQHNLIRSHSCGVGDLLPNDTVRAMQVILAASLCRGRSGVRPLVAEMLVKILNAGIVPEVPKVGSVGASGDLAPLAHSCLVLLGEGTVHYQGARMPAGEALRQAGIQPISLAAKEGLALINGTHMMAGEGSLLLKDFEQLFSAAMLATAMSIDCMRASHSFLDPRVHEARVFDGGQQVAAALRDILRESEIRMSHLEDDPRVQDPYSLRCCVPVIGSALEAQKYVRGCIESELGAVTDNPLVFPLGNGEADIVSAGNFHGMPIAMALDHMSLPIAHVSGISERRVYLMLSGSDVLTGLTPHLAANPGLQSGLMIAQYTAAACQNEIIGLCMPSSVSNIPTCAGTEDYNSFGPRAAFKARQAMERALDVIAIELLCAGEALEYQRPLLSGEGVEQAYRVIRKHVEPLSGDRTTAVDMNAIKTLIKNGELDGIVGLEAEWFRR